MLPDGKIGVDTSIFIYFIQENPEWVDRADRIFAKAASGQSQISTSELTLLEVLAIPYQAGDLAAANRYEALLASSDHVSMVPIDRSILRNAAQLRSLYRLKTADAIQLASALQEQCRAFITNDRRIPEIPGLAVIQLQDLA
jgi:predicted nucleic acid-binding protein